MNSVFEKPCIRTPISIIRRFFESLKWAWQRATKGYCEKDVWNIDSWFLSIIPYMLEELKNTHHGFPGILEEEHRKSLGMTHEDYIKYATQQQKDTIYKHCNKEWDDILKKMIFLFKEASEDNCTKVNQYDEEWIKASDEFEAKYGMFGEKLLTDEEKERDKESGLTTLHGPWELPEYKQICNLHTNESVKIIEYRERCKDEALELFAKYFYNLWD